KNIRIQYVFSESAVEPLNKAVFVWLSGRNKSEFYVLVFTVHFQFICRVFRPVVNPQFFRVTVFKSKTVQDSGYPGRWKAQAYFCCQGFPVVIIDDVKNPDFSTVF